MNATAERIYLKFMRTGEDYPRGRMILTKWRHDATCGVMKKKARPVATYSQAEPTAREIKEAALAYGVRCDVVNVRDARDQFSSLLDRAAAGEQIIITSDGRPKAMIVKYRPIIDGPKWISLRAFRETMSMGPDSAAALDEIRGDRF